ncbi:hypothetical protein DT076_02170 [Desertihabitans brevis]|uniref:Uncharacterized protein n=1 Tax=Desertihabitans brevis TaxID=2268447 RepID=A0A367Z047_9ACTN|nr:hypothetical protein [Desertihabitans brevis]RCK71267.1 hypothetical protein DT076_02170 [Desertihabitans brevis]
MTTSPGAGTPPPADMPAFEPPPPPDPGPEQLDLVPDPPVRRARRGRRGLLLGGGGVLLVLLTALLATWWLTVGRPGSALDQVTDVPPAEAPGPSHPLLLSQLEAAGLHCVRELAEPEVHGCYALPPHGWTYVQWSHDGDEAQGLSLTMPRADVSGDVPPPLLAAVALAVGLSSTELDQLAGAAAEVAGAEAGEVRPVLTRPADFEVWTLGADLRIAFANAGPPLGSIPAADLGLDPAAAVEVLERDGLTCDPATDAALVSCGGHGVDLTLEGDADGRLVAVGAGPPDEARPYLRALLRELPADDREAVEGLLEVEAPVVAAEHGWVVVATGDWLWLRGASW